MDDEEDAYSIESYGGALRYSIEKLLDTYPNLKIFICSQIYRFWMKDNGEFDYDSDTHINGMGYKLTDFIEKTKEIAKEYHLPYIDNYYEVGMNRYNRSHWFPSSDGTHPNVYGLKLIAEHMSNKLF